MEKNEDQEASLLFYQHRLSILQAENQLKKKENEALSTQLKTFKAFIQNLIIAEKEENSNILPNKDSIKILRKVLEFQHERIDHLEKENADLKLKYEKLLFEQNKKDSDEKEEYDRISNIRIDKLNKTYDNFNFFRSSSSFYSRASPEKNLDGSNKDHMAQSRTLFARYSENSDELKRANKTISMLEEKLKEITATSAKQIIDLKAQLTKNNAELIIRTNKNGLGIQDDYHMESLSSSSFMSIKKNVDNKVTGIKLKKNEGIPNFEKEEEIENLNASLNTKKIQMNRNNSELKHTKKNIHDEGKDPILGISLKRKDSLLEPIEKIKNNSYHQKDLGPIVANKLSQSLNDRGSIFSYKK